MSAKYSGSKILEIAEQVERKGSQFYQNAAGWVEEPKLGNLFSQLAEWETTHQELFAQMREDYANELDGLGTFDPDVYMSSNAKLMAALSVFAVSSDLSKQFAGLKNPEDVLRKAIEIEKDTITFYRGLKDFARNMAAEEIIGRIIQEEKRHIKILKQSLEQR